MHTITVAKTYQLKKKLGAGAFGEIFLALNLKNNTEVAVKCESSTLKTPQLYY
jgi:serine/threonine protein kinase